MRTQQYRLDAKGALFDMLQDPEQRKNIRPQQPQVAQRLQAAADQWRREVATQLDKQARPFPVGYATSLITWLPARDGVPHGDVKRSNRFPNCSYFTNWTKTSDSITWDVEVLTPGRYEVGLWYTCPADATGAVVQAAFRNAEVSAPIQEAHDPPAIGAQEDRVPRGESYVKDFRPMPLGTLDLAAGRGDLTLTALDVPGPTVAEIRYVTLKQWEHRITLSCKTAARCRGFRK